MTDRTQAFTLASEMSAIDTRTDYSRASLPIDYNKRLMLFSGRANPQLASRHRGQARAWIWARSS